MTLIALLGFAAFFLSFLVAPMAILVIFYVGFAARDRSKRKVGHAAAPDSPVPDTMAAEARARQSVMERADTEAGQTSASRRLEGR